MRGIADIAEFLPVESTTGRIQWRLVDADWVPAAQAAASVLRGRGDGETLKRSEKRHVFRGSGAVAKAFFMRTWRQKLWRFSRYAPREVRNLLEARRRGLPAPKPYGLGWHKRGPFVETTIVLMEDLVGHTALTDMDITDELLHTVGNRVVDLYRAGCNHIDLGTDNILVDEYGDVRVIDFMHVAFLPEPSDEVLAYNAAYLSQSLQRVGVSEPRCRKWVEYLGAPMDRYEHYLANSLTREERLALR